MRDTKLSLPSQLQFSVSGVGEPGSQGMRLRVSAMHSPCDVHTHGRAGIFHGGRGRGRGGNFHVSRGQIGFLKFSSQKNLCAYELSKCAQLEEVRSKQ